MADISADAQASPALGVPVAGLGTVERFQRAVEAGDHEMLRGLLATDVVLFGPVVAEPVRGIRSAGAVLWAAVARFEDISYFGRSAGHTLRGDDGADVETHVLRFRATVNGRHIEGVDVIELNGDGLISALTVLFRPLESVLRTTFVPRRYRALT